MKILPLLALVLSFGFGAPSAFADALVYNDAEKTMIVQFMCDSGEKARFRVAANDSLRISSNHFSLDDFCYIRAIVPDVPTPEYGIEDGDELFLKPDGAFSQAAG